MGAMQALQWGCLHPTRVQRIAAVSEQQQQQHLPELHTEIERAVMHVGLIPRLLESTAQVCGAARTGDYNKVFLESLRAAASADPAFNNGWFSEVRRNALTALRRRASVARDLLLLWGLSALLTERSFCALLWLCSLAAAAVPVARPSRIRPSVRWLGALARVLQEGAVARAGLL